eukprot:gene8716-10736_t
MAVTQALGAGAGQLHGACVAQEQRYAHFFFQRLDLAADGGLGQGQFFGGSAKVQVPGDGFKCAQLAGSYRAGAQAHHSGSSTRFTEAKEPVMSARNVLESQQSVHAATAGRRAAGCWKLATGQALSLHPNSHGVLQIAQGQAWVTLRGVLADMPGAAVDHVLRPGQQLTV